MFGRRGCPVAGVGTACATRASPHAPNSRTKRVTNPITLGQNARTHTNTGPATAATNANVH
eukprot:7830807-Lingulodinium_polyedra.AAC.1